MENFISKNRKAIFLIFAAFLILGNSVAQTSNTITLNWSGTIDLVDSNGVNRTLPYFTGAVYTHSNIPEYQFDVEGYVETIHILNANTSALSSNQQKNLTLLSEEGFKTRIRYGLEKGRVVSTINLTPIRNSGSGNLERLNSFDYKLSFGAAPTLMRGSSRTDNLNRNYSAGNLRVAAGASSSVLATGEWYKFSISSSGIFKLDYEALQNAGINVSAIDPRTIKIYGNGGGMLPQSNAAPRMDDLVENDVLVIGQNDGSFDPGDYILFYGIGPHTWSRNGDKFIHSYNLYSDQSFYFLTYGGSTGARVAGKVSPDNPTQTVTSFDEHLFYEKDQVSIIRSGRNWYGERFDYINPSRSFPFNAEGLISGTDVSLTLSSVAAATVGTSFNVGVNSQSIGTQYIDGIYNLFSYAYSRKGVERTSTFTFKPNMIGGNVLNVNLSYNYQSNSSFSAYLNYIELNFKKNLALFGTQTTFRSIASENSMVSEFQISGPKAGMQIWDISDPLKPVSMAYTISNGKAIFVDSSNALHEYVVFSGNSFDSPSFAGKVKNQNLHAIGAPVPDLLIISADNFVTSAQRLANHRRNYSGMDVEVVKISEVYNEFSSGAQDITAVRDFVKMVYERSQGADSLRYVLLFGDCSFDYKDRLKNNTNFIPIYEARESLHPVNTYSSDDYFGFMDNNEGDWPEPDNGNVHKLDLGVGRLPVNNITEAEILVDKIIYYDTNPSTRKNWRNRICFVADDGDSNNHLNGAENLSTMVAQNYPLFNISKVFLDAFPQVSSPGGEISPLAKQMITDEVEKGVLITNYTGHGGESGWTQERILEISDITSWENKEALTFMVTATCEFGRYDDPSLPSGAEYAIRSSQGGAIALMTTTRPVYSSSNDLINEAMYENIFQKVNGQWPTLGDLMYKTKNDAISGVFNRNYSLLGDPSMTLAYPKEEVVITSINGKNPLLEVDTLKALTKVTIEGEVHVGGLISTSFNGTLNATVFDKNTEIQTLGNESSPTFYTKYNNSIYDGKASVSEGKFKFTFVVPKDISYITGTGKISLYAARSGSTLDAGGDNTDIIIGGSSDSVVVDNTPPSMQVYINDETFVNGGVAGSDAVLLVNLFDENGINIAGTGIGHELTAVLDDSKDVIVLNDYYSSKLDNFQEGVIEFPLRDLAPGNHSIKVKAWDTHNNSQEGYIEFVVINEEDLALQNVFNYPNPFSTNTEFHFDHNRAGDDMQVLLQVYTISGKLIKTLRKEIYQSDSHISNLYWDGRDDFGDKIGKGVYVYKLEIRSIRDGSKEHKYQKLVILN